jgi:hypothetical protein
MHLRKCFGRTQLRSTWIEYFLQNLIFALRPGGSLLSSLMKKVSKEIKGCNPNAKILKIFLKMLKLLRRTAAFFNRNILKIS